MAATALSALGNDRIAMGANGGPTNQCLHECLIYDAEAGTLLWRARPRHHFKTGHHHRSWNTRYAGQPAGALQAGYFKVRLFGRGYLVHRVIFAMHHGLDMDAVPAEIDHRDLDSQNNRHANLRPSSHAQNLANQGKKSSNTSGFKGVSWEARYKHWEARIRHGGKRHHLGYFTTAEEAHAAYCEAAKTLHGEFARTA